MIKIFFTLTWILLLVVVASSDSSSCPTIPIIKDFDLDKYLGKWYEIQRFPNFFQSKALQCVSAVYEKINSTTISVSNRAFDILENKVSGADGFGVLVDLNQPNKLLVTFPSNEYNRYAIKPNYQVVDSDFTNYSMVYSCEKNGDVLIEFAWILSRKRTLDADTVEKLENKLASLNINPKRFVKTVQTC